MGRRWLAGLVGVGAIWAALGGAPGSSVAPVSASGRAEALLLGDSVMNGMAQRYSTAARSLLAAKHSFILDTAGCRRLIGYSCHIGTRPAPTTALYELLTHAGTFDKVIVVGAGYNDPTTGAEGIGAAVDTFMKVAKAQNVRWVIWLTYREAGGGNIIRLHNHNLVLAAKARQYKNLRIADWAATSRHLPASWFSADGIHLGGNAASAMAGLISRSIDALPPMNRCDALFLTGRTPPASAALATLPPQRVQLLAAPSRIANSRTLWGAVGSGRELVVPIGGVAGVPAAATGALVQVTADQPCAPVDVKVHPCGAALPDLPNLSATTTATVATFTRLNRGSLCVWASAPTDLQVDVVGYTQSSSGGRVVSSDTVLFDSTGGVPQALSVASHRLVRGERLTLSLTDGSVPAIGPGSGVSGVQLLITVSNADTRGRLFVLPGACTAAVSPVVTGSYSAGDTAALVAIARLSAGKVCLISEAAADVLVRLTAVIATPGAEVQLPALSGPLDLARYVVP